MATVCNFRVHFWNSYSFLSRRFARFFPLFMQAFFFRPISRLNTEIFEFRKNFFCSIFLGPKGVRIQIVGHGGVARSRGRQLQIPPGYNWKKKNSEIKVSWVDHVNSTHDILYGKDLEGMARRGSTKKFCSRSDVEKVEIFWKNLIFFILSWVRIELMTSQSLRVLSKGDIKDVKEPKEHISLSVICWKSWNLLRKFDFLIPSCVRIEIMTS